MSIPITSYNYFDTNSIDFMSKLALYSFSITKSIHFHIYSLIVIFLIIYFVYFVNMYPVISLYYVNIISLSIEAIIPSISRSFIYFLMYFVTMRQLHPFFPHYVWWCPNNIVLYWLDSFYFTFFPIIGCLLWLIFIPSYSHTRNVYQLTIY